MAMLLSNCWCYPIFYLQAFQLPLFFFSSPFDLCLLPFLNPCSACIPFPEHHPATCSPHANSSNGYLCTLPPNSTTPPCINTVWHSQAVCVSQLIIPHLWLAISHFVSALREHSVTSAAFQILLGHCSFIIDSKELKPSVVLQKAPQTSFLKSQHNSLDVLKWCECWANSYSTLRGREGKGYTSPCSAGANVICTKWYLFLLSKCKFNSHFQMTSWNVIPATCYTGISATAPRLPGSC